ncbi:MAG: MmcQ/YjbR family DNA-binding protein [Actinomycetota bacterium]
MTPDALRRRCLAKAGAWEDFPFGPETSVFKVGSKLFAISALDAEPLTVSVKCDPEVAVALRAHHPSIRPGYHLNKRHWNTVTLDGSLEADQVMALIDDSYDLVVSSLPRAERDAIGPVNPGGSRS